MNRVENENKIFYLDYIPVLSWISAIAHFCHINSQEEKKMNLTSSLAIGHI